MREIGSNLSDGRETAETADMLLRNGLMRQIYGQQPQIESFSSYSAAFDTFQKQILQACFQERPTGTIREEAESFLERFSFVRDSLIYKHDIESGDERLRSICCLIDTTPVSLTKKAVEIREEEEQRGDVEMVDDWNLVISITREASKIWREGTRERFTLD